MNSEPLTVDEARAHLGERIFDAILWCNADRTIALLCPALVFWEIVNDEVLPPLLWCDVRSWTELINRVSFVHSSPQGHVASAPASKSASAPAPTPASSLAKAIQLWQADVIPRKPVPSIVYIMPDPGNVNWYVRVNWTYGPASSYSASSYSASSSSSPCAMPIRDFETPISAILKKINPKAIIHARTEVSSSGTSPSQELSQTTTINDPGFKFHYESKIFRRTPAPKAIIYPFERRTMEEDADGLSESDNGLRESDNGLSESDDGLRESDDDPDASTLVDTFLDALFPSS